MPFLTIRVIQHATADALNMPRKHMTGKTRVQEIARARQIAMFLSRTLMPRMSYPKIGSFFERDHTTVMHAEEQVKLRLANRDLVTIRNVGKVKAMLESMGYDPTKAKTRDWLFVGPIPEQNDA